jgi:integrase/recombinase XerD
MKSPKPFVIAKRADSKTYQLTLNFTCGLQERICKEWKRRSFKDFPNELAQFRNPKNKSAAEAGAFALTKYLKEKQGEGGGCRVTVEDITVGAWLEKFTMIETSPRTSINASRNKPYSIATIKTYKKYFDCHIKSDPIVELKMAEIEEQDILGFNTRMSVKKIEHKRLMGGTRTYKGVLLFVRMAFKSFQMQRANHKWVNPYLYIGSPNYESPSRDILPEDEVLKLFEPGVLKGTMELAVCAAMFLAGLRWAEIFALKPEDLDWKTPKITVLSAWQLFERKSRVLGPTKSKKTRDAPFDPILQEAILKLWEENGKHEFAICHKDGKVPHAKWVSCRFPKWLERAGIELGGRKIVPHSARHSLASLLEDRGVSLRYIQELLGHSDLKTTKIYLHSTSKTIRDIGMKIAEAREKAYPEQKEEQNNIVNFRVS